MDSQGAGPLALSIHPEARREITTARLWYARRNPSAARRFVAQVEAAFDALCSRPRMYPLWRGRAGREGVRKRAVWQFPYLVPYRPDEDIALVLAVAHQRRRSPYWLPRLLSVLRARRGQALAGQ